MSKASGRRYKDVSGQRFGYLTAVRWLECREGKHSIWEMACDCGRLIQLPRTAFADGRQKSCGCKQKELQAEKRTKHGMVKSSLYTTWANMKARCSNPKAKHFEHYGGRGIRVCDRWQDSFEAFYEDMGERPSPRYTVDRIDNDGDYEPSNCRWATRKQQQRNRRGVVNLTIGGVTRCLSEWSEVSGVPYSTIRARMVRGLSPEQVIQRKA